MDFDADKISWQQVSKKNNPFKRLKIYLAVSRTRRLSDVIESDTLSVKWCSGQFAIYRHFWKLLFQTILVL